MKTVFISAQEQLYNMREIHCNSGVSSIEAIRDEMTLDFRVFYGKNVDIEYEALSKKDYQDFQHFMAQTED